MNDTLINQAYKLARKLHKRQKYNGRPFMYHPMQVKKIITLLFPLDYKLQVAAILHDTIEDCGVSYLRLEREFGSPIANLVREVTKRNAIDKSKSAFFPYLHTQRGIILKFADRLCNLANMANWNKKKKRWYLKKSKFWRSEE